MVWRYDLLKMAVMPPRRAYRTDLSDARWALIEPVLAAWRAARAEAGLGLSKPVHDLREIVNAILYVNRTGITVAVFRSVTAPQLSVAHG